MLATGAKVCCGDEVGESSCFGLNEADKTHMPTPSIYRSIA